MSCVESYMHMHMCMSCACTCACMCMCVCVCVCMCMHVCCVRLQVELREKHAPVRLELRHAPCRRRRVLLRRVLRRVFGLGSGAPHPTLRTLSTLHRENGALVVT